MEISGNQIPLSKYVSIKIKTSPGDGKKREKKEQEKEFKRHVSLIIPNC